MAPQQAEAPEPLLLTLQQASDLLNIPKSTLLGWAWTGAHGLPVVRIGRKRMFRRSDLVDWVDRHVCPPRSVLSPMAQRFAARRDRLSARKGA